SARVHTIAGCLIVRVWKPTREAAQPGRRFADSCRIERLHLRWRQIGDCAAAVDVADVAVAQCIQRNSPLDESGADDAGVVEVEKEERLVLLDWAADVAAELILDKVIARNDRVRVVAEPTVG